MATESTDAGSITNSDLKGLNDNELGRFWTAEITRSCKYFDQWWQAGDKILDRYRDTRGLNDSQNRRTSEGGQIQTKRFNILWSNVQTLFPALYNGVPDPNVSRRYDDDDPLARLAVEISERTLRYVIDPDISEGALDAATRLAVNDYLLPGRGQVWISYEKEVEKTTESTDPIYGDNEEILVEAQEETTEETKSECLNHTHVQYRDFGHMPTPNWDENLRRGYVWRKIYMTKKQLEDKFGYEKAKDIQLTASDMTTTGARTSNPDRKTGTGKLYAEVFEIWNKPDRMQYYYAKGHPVILEKKPDPLGLRNFYPCPRPLYTTMTPDSSIPVPDFDEYLDQSLSLDEITNRKWLLTTALRVAGFYAGKEAAKFQQLFNGATQNTMIPVQDWESFEQGVDKLVTWMPIDMVIQALAGLQQMEDDNKQQIYEITGIADIVRGQSKASETLGAQRIKGQWASVRISDRQATVAAFVRDIMRIDAEIIAEHYDPKTIAEMTNFVNSGFAEEYGPVFFQAVDLLKNDKMRSFRVDVETQDTVFADQNQERQQNVEMLGAMAQFMTAAGEIVAAEPAAVDVVGEMLKIGVKSFHGSNARLLEGKVDEMIATKKQEAEKIKDSPPQPTPEQLEAQADQQKTQQDGQLEAGKLQLQGQKQQMDAQNDETKNIIAFQNAERDREVQIRGQNIDAAKAVADDNAKAADRLAKLLSGVSSA